MTTSIETARVAFYSATQCGFYKRADKAAAFGGLADTFTQLEKWGSGADLSVTKLIDLDPGSEDLPVYLIGVAPIGKDWVMACWNEVPSSEGAIASISKSSKVGEPPRVHENTVSPNTIPGYPTYFYVSPPHNAVAAITFDGAATRIKSMARYVRRFLQLESSYAVTVDDGQGVLKIVGYTNKGDDVPLPVGPRFVLDTYRKPGRRAFLLDNSARVIRVLRKGHVTLDKALDKRLFQSFVQFVRGDKARADVVTGIHTINVELDYTPTKTELAAMIDAEQADDDLLQWERLGFELKGEDRPIWVNRTLATGEVDLAVERNSRVITLESFAAAVQAKRGGLLKLLQDD